MLRAFAFTVGVVCSLVAVMYTCGFALQGDSDVNVINTTLGLRAVDSLKFMIIVSRHGNRGSDYDYPGDPYPTSDKVYWPDGAASLSPRGRSQVYSLGRRIRSLYTGFIPDIYSTDDIISRSSYLDRTLMSGEGVLAGLYPPRGNQVWDHHLLWQPTVLYSDSPDNSLIVSSDCNRFIAHFQSTLAQMKEKYADHQNYLKEYVYNSTGENTTSLNEFYLWDKLTCEVTEGYDIPDWAKTIYPDTLMPFVIEQYNRIWGGSDEIVRLVVGEMYEQMLNAMVQKVNGSLTPDRKILYYSAHDTSIIGLQRIFGVPPQSMVGMVRPASSFIIELHQDFMTNHHYLQAVYLNGANLDQEPRTMNITSNFLSLVNDTNKFLQVNFKEECK